MLNAENRVSTKRTRDAQNIIFPFQIKDFCQTNSVYARTIWEGKK